jgi:hypothetical protein
MAVRSATRTGCSLLTRTIFFYFFVCYSFHFILTLLIIYLAEVEPRPPIGLLYQPSMIDYDVRFEVFTAVTMKNGVFWVWRLPFIRVTKIGELGTTQAATSNRRTLRS